MPYLFSFLEKSLQKSKTRGNIFWFLSEGEIQRLIRSERKFLEQIRCQKYRIFAHCILLPLKNLIFYAVFRPPPQDPTIQPDFYPASGDCEKIGRHDQIR